MDGRHGADGARLADPLGAQGVHGSRRLHLQQLEGRELGGRDRRVVGEVRRERVALGVVAELLEQHLGHALGDAAVALALDDERVQHAAGVVDRHVAQQAHGARLDVDLDDRRVGAEGVGGRRGLEHVGGVDRLAGRRHHLGPAQAAGRRARHVEGAGRGVEHHVVERRLEAVGRDPAGPGDGVDGRTVDGRPAELQRARAEGPHAGGHPVGVAVDDGDPLQRDARHLGHDHGPGGLVALPVRGGARVGRDPTVGADDHPAVLGARVRPGRRLDVAADPDAEQLRLAAARGAGAGPPGAAAGRARPRRRRAPGCSRRCRRSCRPGVSCGNASGASRLRRRTSTGSRPAAAAKRSTARSIAHAASGRPAPRYADSGAVFVTTARATARTHGMA